MINMAVPHLGQSGPNMRVGEWGVNAVPGIGATPPLHAGPQPALSHRRLDQTRSRMEERYHQGGDAAVTYVCSLC
jgi:hypothetical protein